VFRFRLLNQESNMTHQHEQSGAKLPWIMNHRYQSFAIYCSVRYYNTSYPLKLLREALSDTTRKVNITTTLLQAA
jgi:hypothetical protein